MACVVDTQFNIIAQHNIVAIAVLCCVIIILASLLNDSKLRTCSSKQNCF